MPAGWLREGLIGFGGLQLFNFKQHLKALSLADSYTSACCIRIWTGTVMTASRRALMGKGRAGCRCGAEVQTFAHLLWACPLVPPEEFLRVSELPPSQSVAHLLPMGADTRDIHVWKLSMPRAMKIMNMYDLGEKQWEEQPALERDLKGHHLCTSEDGLTSFALDALWQEEREIENGSLPKPSQNVSLEAYMRSSYIRDMEWS